MFDFAQFTSCSPLISAIPGNPLAHKFVLTWTYPNYATAQYRKVELYRWIGEKDGPCGFPTTFTLDAKYLIKTYTNSSTNPLSGHTTYTDNLTDYYFGVHAPPRLGSIIGELGVTDRQILDEVYTAQRPIYYIIQSYARSGGFDTVPYVICSHNATGWLDNVSTKTQVKNNILRAEGDRMWETRLWNPERHNYATTISRTAVDINRLYQDSLNHAGPTGRGGWCWTTSRASGGQAYRVELGTGRQSAVYGGTDQGAQGNGVGIAIEVESGDAIFGTVTDYGAGPSHIYRAKVSPLVEGYVASQKEYVYPIGPGASNLYNGRNYGMTVQYGQPGTYFVNEKQNYAKIIRITKNGSSWISTNIQDLPGALQQYGINSGPDGTIFWDIDEDDPIYAWSATTGLTYYLGAMPSTEINRGVTTDNPALYPNNGTQYGVYAVNTHSQICRRVTWDVTTQSFVGGSLGAPWGPLGFEPYGVGADSENNIWVVGANVAKIYRMANTEDFPYGGKCRYPAVRLSAWPFTLTNWREVEWFLTRDPTLFSPGTQMFLGSSLTPAAAWLAMVVGGPFVYNGVFIDGVQTTSTNNGFTVAGTERNSMTPAASTYALQYIQEWDRVYGTIAQNLCGLQLYPYYIPAGGLNGIKKFGQPRGGSYEYSDFTGSVLVGALSQLPVNYAVIHPATTPMQATISIEEATESNPLPIVEDQWKPVSYDTTSNTHQVTGYDDLTVDFLGTVNPGTFVPRRWRYTFDDYVRDYNYNLNTNSYEVSTNSNYIPNFAYDLDTTASHMYHDTSKVGLSSNISNDIRNPDGTFLVGLSVYSNTSPYPEDNCAPNRADADPAHIIVLERWPEARFFIQQTELDHYPIRYNWFGCPIYWGRPSRFAKVANYTIPTNKYAEDNVAYGVDPVSARFFDRTIARTYPISTWHLTISTTNVWSEEISTEWTPGDTTWPFVSSIWIEEYNAANLWNHLPADTQNTELRPATASRLVQGNIFRYGLYSATLDVTAAHSDTTSEDTWTEHLCVKEFEPFANFWSISAQTVPSNYSDETIGPRASDLITDAYAMIPNITHNFVSGYAPNLTVWFKDSSEAHTFPISSYHWNFGDYYHEPTNTLELSTTIHAGTFDGGCWQMQTVNVYDGRASTLVNNGVGHIVKHTYVMPGIYDVTLCVRASNTSTQDCCARYEAPDQFYVYVKEIPPDCCFTVFSTAQDFYGNITGPAPIVVQVNAQCVIPGSFPICRLSWDWDDGTPIESITRSPFSTASNLGTPLVYQSFFPQDTADPRNWWLSHTYNVVGASAYTFNPRLCVYACNTNTMAGPCTSWFIGPVSAAFLDLLEARHLINNRYVNENNDLLYVFEGETLNTAYTVVLSAT